MPSVIQKNLSVLDLGLQRAVGVLAPVRNELVERHRIDHRAGQDVRADFGALLHHDNGQIGIELLQPDRRAERPDGPAPTITTSNSMDSRGGNSSLLMIWSRPG